MHRIVAPLYTDYSFKSISQLDKYFLFYSDFRFDQTGSSIPNLLIKTHFMINLRYMAYLIINQIIKSN